MHIYAYMDPVGPHGGHGPPIGPRWTGLVRSLLCPGVPIWGDLWGSPGGARFSAPATSTATQTASATATRVKQ